MRSHVVADFPCAFFLLMMVDQIDEHVAGYNSWERSPCALLLMVVEQIDGLVAGYKIPGQYIQMKVGDSKPAYIALASSPKESQR
jgi:hypothetical protein